VSRSPGLRPQRRVSLAATFTSFQGECAPRIRCRSPRRRTRHFQDATRGSFLATRSPGHPRRHAPCSTNVMAHFRFGPAWNTRRAALLLTALCASVGACSDGTENPSPQAGGAAGQSTGARTGSGGFMQSGGAFGLGGGDSLHTGGFSVSGGESASGGDSPTGVGGIGLGGAVFAGGTASGGFTGIQPPFGTGGV
jgi:hypothetical protein